MALGNSVWQAVLMAEEDALLCNGLFCVCCGETKVSQRVPSSAGHAGFPKFQASCTALDRAGWCMC